MKVEIVLVILSIAFVNSSNHSDFTEVSNKSDHNVAHINPSHEKRRMPSFRKNMPKFTVTMKSPIARSIASHNFKPSRKPLKLTITPTAVKRNTHQWNTAITRRPIMRHIQFTVKPLNTFKLPEYLKNRGKSIGRKHKSIILNKTNNGTENSDSSEEISESSNARKQDKGKYFRASLSPLYKLRTNVNIKKEENISSSKETDSKSVMNITKNTNVSETEISSEEQEDREEFIFVDHKKIKQTDGNAIKEDSAESDEITTVMDEETKMRLKRSINVIEEENLGTTVSGFKFTGQVAPLSNDLIFRNINT